MADFAAIFTLPFDEQVAAFRLRLLQLVPTFRWDDLVKAQHDRAFMVAGAQKADLLADLAEAVRKAIEEGTSLEAFRADFRGVVEGHGWHGWTGEGTAAGEAWRTRVIYRTNTRTSYHAGRYAQLQAAGHKYWVYRHGGSRDPRPEHLALDGLILPADHPFWKIWWPPNGWGCSCYVVGAPSRRIAELMGGNPDVRLPDGWDTIDPRTGAPRGIDKGWDYAPGASVAAEVQALTPKIEHLPDRMSIDLIQSWVRAGLFERWIANPTGSFPLVRVRREQAEKIGSRQTVAHLSAETAAKQLREHPELMVLEYADAQRVVQNATHVVRDSPKSLVFMLTEPDGYVLVVKATRDGEALFVTSFRRLSRDAAKRDREVGRILARGR